VHSNRRNPRDESPEIGKRALIGRLAVISLLLAGFLLAPASNAWAERKSYTAPSTYDAAEAGHPIKVVYYVVYPVGLLLDTLILKPAWWLGQHEPFRTVFGVDAVRSSF
jgi:hypothetical protein